MAKVKAVFYLPLRDNNGRRLAAEIDDVEMELFVRFVGWTHEGFVKGVWRMADGSRSVDESAAYSVAMDEKARARVGSSVATVQSDSARSNLPRNPAVGRSSLSLGAEEMSLTQEQTQEVERILATASTAAGLADQLFSPSGLFALWTRSEAERRVLTTALIVFKNVRQRRFRELQAQEAARSRLPLTLPRRGTREDCSSGTV